MPIELDSQAWPFVQIHFSGALLGDDLDTYHAVYDKLLRLGRHVVVEIHDGDAPMPASRKLRQRADWIAQRDAILREHCLGIAFVLPGAVSRGALKAMMWMQKLPFPYQVFEHTDSLAAAERWARERLVERPGASLRASGTGPSTVDVPT